MKILICAVLLGFGLAACNDGETLSNQEFTGNEVVYSLEQGSEFDIHGSVTFKEKTDGTTVIAVELSGTQDGAKHPVHLHLGDISSPGVDVAALLNPVDGKSGQSETHLVRLADETPISYPALVNLNACIKIHLAAVGPDRDIILAGGNIGQAAASLAGGRAGIGVCKSE